MTDYTVSPTSTYPYNDVCYLTVDLDGVAYRGSGVIIGPHTVLTAAHMVYDSATGATATNIDVFPGYTSSVDTTDGQAQAGVVAVHHFAISDANGLQYQASSPYDFAVIDFSTTFTSWLGVETNYSGGTVTVAGYPGYPSGVETGSMSYQQWTSSGTVTADSAFNVLDYNTLATLPGNSGGPLWIDTGTSSTSLPYVVGVVSTSGWAAQLTDSTWQTIYNWETADSSYWTTATDATQAVTKFVSIENATRQAAGWTSDLNTAGIATTSGTNSVIGWESANLPSGHNTVVLDGLRSNYQIQVDGSGLTVIHDTTANSNIVVEGATYLVFDGASAQTPGLYDQIVFVEGGANSGQDAQLVRLYEADVGREPDLAGLESWQAQIDAGSMTVNQVASYFVTSQEFATRYGANLDDQGFIAALYENVLGRPAETSALTAWTAYLQSVEAQSSGSQSDIAAIRGSILLDFANGQECLDRVSSWLIDTTKGGYADSGELLDAATVLNQAVDQHYLNLNLIDPTSITSKGVVSYDFVYPDTASTAGSGFLLSQNEIYVENDSNTIVMSDNITYATLDGSNNSIYATNSTTNIDCYGSNEIIFLGSNSSTKISDYSVGEIIHSFIPGQNVLYSALNVDNISEVMMNAASGQTVAGITLNFQQNFYVLELGSVKSGSAADVAAAANAVYAVAGTAAKGIELLEIIGQTTGNDTVVYQWGTGTQNADANSNNQVDVAELYQVATLVGVQTQTLTTHDLT